MAERSRGYQGGSLPEGIPAAKNKRSRRKTVLSRRRNHFVAPPQPQRVRESHVHQNPTLARISLV